MAVNVFYGSCRGERKGVWGKADDGVLFVFVVKVFGSEGVGAVVEVGQVGEAGEGG